MKKTVYFLVSLCFVLTLAFAPVSAEEPIRVLVDGRQLAFDVDPVIENDRTLVPMRLIFEALGAKVDWDAATRTVQISTQKQPEKQTEPGSQTDKPEQPNSQVPDQPEEQDSKAPENQIPEGFVSFGELSEADMNTLKSRYNNLIRYDFEQMYLPRAVIVENTSFAKEINSESETAQSLAQDVWNKIVISHLIEIQVNSETSYYIDTVSESELYDTYMSIVKKAGLAAEDQFDVSFETLANGYNMMLVTFKKTDTLLACKYLGIVAMPNGTVRYFTAETDLSDKENLYFCEVAKDKRGTIGRMGFEKEDFLECAWITIKNDLPMVGSLNRKL